MKILRGRRLLAVFVVILAATCAWVWARPAVSVPVRSAVSVPLASTAVLRVDTSRPGNDFEVGAVGFSTEAEELSSGRLSAGYPSLVRLMRLLGPSVLRIGGNSVDLSWWTSSGESSPPWATNTVTPADLSALRGLLTATGWRVLFGVDLGHFEPTRAADEARIAQQILGADLLGIEIGNEPDDFGQQQVNLRPSTYNVSEYLREAEGYSHALKTSAPGVAVYGPALTQKTTWLTQMGAAASMFAEITQHYYATGTCPGKPPAVQPTISGLLSPAVRQNEDEVLEALVQAGAVAGRPTRIGETNNTACMGSPSASPVFASALWALDWALRAASSGVKSLNFHGDLGVCGSHSESPICAPSDEAREVAAQPEYYGMLAASRLEGGRFVPTSLIDPDPLPNLTTWATIAPGGTVRIAIDNLATEGLAQPVSIPISGYAATYETVVGPSAEARTGITLGGAPVTSAGHWRPKSTRAKRQHTLRVVVRPASAIIVTLRRKHHRG
jgi:hypothetical protein